MHCDFSGLVLLFCCLFLEFLEPFGCLCLIELVFFVDTFRGLLYSLKEFISFHSLFILSLHSIDRVRKNRELYRRDICRPQIWDGPRFTLFNLILIHLM